MRLLCDEMFARLARLLRAAGHDTALAGPGSLDAALLDLARNEDRLLLTRDRRLAERAGSAGLLVRGDQLVEQALALANQVDVDWLHAPFTRCLIDNTVLRAASESQAASLPVSVRERPGPFTACPSCGRLFWPGSHVKRVMAVLNDLNARWPSARISGLDGRPVP